MAQINITVDEPSKPEVIELTTGIIGPPGPQGATGPPGAPSPQYHGPWSPLTTYHPDELVSRNGSTWIAIATNTNVDPGADSSFSPVASMIPSSTLPFGSPTSQAMGFRVDRGTNVEALNLAQAWTGASGGTVGLASAINVPGVGVQWIGKGPIQMPVGRVVLDNPAALVPGVTYFLVMVMPTSNLMIDQKEDMANSHLTWQSLWYGSTGPTTDLGIYAIPCIFYGTTDASPWQVYAAQGDPGPMKVLTQAQYDALPVKDPGTVYVVT